MTKNICFLRHRRKVELRNYTGAINASDVAAKAASVVTDAVQITGQSKSNVTVESNRNGIYLTLTEYLEPFPDEERISQMTNLAKHLGYKERPPTI